jgi:hypothetical protein
MVRFLLKTKTYLTYIELFEHRVTGFIYMLSILSNIRSNSNRHDIAEILLKVALNTRTLTLSKSL